MSCLFIHDFRSYTYNGEVYTGNLSYAIWKDRYIKYFGTVNVLNRTTETKTKEITNRMVKASGENVVFLNEIEVFTPITFAKNYRKYKKIVWENIDNNEYVIIRLDSFLGFIAAKRCREIGKRYLIEVVGCVWDSFWNKGLFGKLVAYPLLKIMQKEIKHAPFVVYVTDKFLQERYPTKGRTESISNVYIPKHDQSVLSDRLNRISREKMQTLHLVTVASVSVRYKGQASVIRAISKLKSIDNFNFKYHLIGSGDPSYLKGLVKRYDVLDQVEFHGPMKHDEVISFLDNCDVYIQPSKQEGLPRALIEAMSRGMLCFGSNVAGIPELLDSEMLFSKKKTNYIEIANLLKSITKQQLIEQAERNYFEAQKYEIDHLNQRRDYFFTEFRDSNIKDEDK